MKTLSTKIIAAALVASSLVGAASSAFADEYLTASNKEFQAVAAGAYDNGDKLPLNAAPTSGTVQMHEARQFPAPQVPAYGPFSDTDPHSGPAQAG
ncbi:hypothetical protein [Azorhizobium]|uniref:Uncharacterized protein n=1 Tax=Azorhizobium caulinodans (strain ATCC 43989 / DSM 5975 / JCM 20966 / LMG 6465 / NBRC 14845 / NCIMB 13405 / ORS 571) TaxID=438753 RepID=A8IEH8_AZOC5|nr:hypothetical protein [Azorhizobium]TDU01179.1 hypothetical protein DFO45_0696 [Azorhizobium sp. AG788]BAF89491.1 unknown protein [Azorhizobium caulinodans ORS 571]